jgi:hypothetical protein
VKIPIDGGTKVTIASGAGLANTSQMVIGGTNAYFTNLGDGTDNGSVMKVPLIGGPGTSRAQHLDREPRRLPKRHRRLERSLVHAHGALSLAR